jgi:hypothetical protein
MTISGVKSSIILCKLAQIFSSRQFKNKISFNFVIFVAIKKRMITNPPPLSFVAVFGSGIDKIQDPGL